MLFIVILMLALILTLFALSISALRYVIRKSRHRKTIRKRITQ